MTYTSDVYLFHEKTLPSRDNEFVKPTFHVPFTHSTETFLHRKRVPFAHFTILVAIWRRAGEKLTHTCDRQPHTHATAMMIRSLESCSTGPFIKYAIPDSASAPGLCTRNLCHGLPHRFAQTSLHHATRAPSPGESSSSKHDAFLSTRSPTYSSYAQMCLTPRGWTARASPKR